MDFYQGSTPLNFIPFCLGEQKVEKLPETANLQVPIDPVATPHPADSSHISQTQGSSGSAESDVDVIRFADDMVAIMEKTQVANTKPSDELVDEDMQGFPTQPCCQGQDHTAPMVRSSTPVSDESPFINQTSISALGSGLRVVQSSRNSLQELIRISDTSAETSSVTAVQQEEDTASSVHDAPALPRLGHKVKFLVDPSESENTGVKASQTISSFIPRFLEVQNLAQRVEMSLGPHNSTAQRTEVRIQELSGRSRALLKEYFEKNYHFLAPHGTFYHGIHRISGVQIASYHYQ